MRKILDILIHILAWLIGVFLAVSFVFVDLKFWSKDKKARQRKFDRNEVPRYILNFKPINDRVAIDLEYLLMLDKDGVIRIKSPNRRVVEMAILKGAWQKENDSVVEVLIEDDSDQDIINRIQGSIIQQ